MNTTEKQTALSADASSGQNNSRWFDDRFFDVLKRIDTRYKIIIISSLIWGVLAHGMALFNKYSVHDDATYFFGVGATYMSGRWMLGIIDSVFSVLTRHYPFSLPLVNGAISIVFIAVCACIIVNLFDIKGRLSCIVLSGVLVTMPVISSLFGYMYTAPYYMFAFFLTVTGCYLICKKPGILRLIFGIVLIACAVGIYQAFYPVALSLLLLYIIRYVYCEEELTIPGFLKKAGVLLMSALCSIGLYFLLNRLFLRLTNTELIDYQGISSMGSMSPSEFFQRLLSAYRLFFFPDKASTATFYTPRNGQYYYVFLLILCAFAIAMLITVFRKSLKKGIILTLLFLLIPLAVNGIYIMCEEKTVHTVMAVGFVTIFLFFIWIFENIDINFKKTNRIIGIVGVAVVFIFSTFYAVYDNIVYFYVDIKQEQAISYLTCMESQIKSTPGYSDEYPVAFVYSPEYKTSLETNDQSMIDPEFDYGFYVINTVPYRAFETQELLVIRTDYNWRRFMRLWTGYNPTVVSSDEFSELPEVEEMPAYPDDGSIKIINDTVVVKL